jgi:hypothetical protein
MNSGLSRFIEDPALRYRRILVPALAYMLALGRQQWIDAAYEAVLLVWIALGVWWCARIAAQSGLAAAWGLLFLATPAVLVTIDRRVVDAALAALTAAFLYYSRTPSWKLFLALSLAVLTRETGFFLILGYCGYRPLQREWRPAALSLVCAAPAIAWYGYVHGRAVSHPYEGSFIPLSAILRAFANPAKYPAGTPLVAGVVAADYLALIGVMLAFAFALYLCLRGPLDPARTTALLFTLAGTIFQRTDHWQNVYDYGRVYTPLLLCLIVIAARERRLWLLAPLALMLPRIAIQLTPQVIGVVRWVL